MRATPTLDERIASAGANLTPTERRLARLILDDPTIVAFGTVADLAKEAETSGPSVVRFAAKLDYDGYGGLQDHVRASLAEQLKRPTDRIRLVSGTAADADGDANQTDGPTGSKSDLTERLTRAVAAVDDNSIGELATSIADASGTVWILCARTSATPGALLGGNLRLLRSDVRLLGGAPPDMAAQLADAGPGDLAVVVDFPRYESAVVAAANELATSGVTIIAITDGPFSPLASIADRWIGIDAEAIGPFDSVLPVVAVIETLIAETARLLRRQATDRLDHIERLWAGGSVFEGEVFDQPNPPGTAIPPSTP